MGLVSLDPAHRDFVKDYLTQGFEKLRSRLGKAYPEVFLILGNDDGRFEEAAFLDLAATGLWIYAHNRRCPLSQYEVYGYAYVPPTPFMLKDWERYDVSRFVPPGCVSPEDGQRSVSAAARTRSPPQSLHTGSRSAYIVDLHGARPPPGGIPIRLGANRWAVPSRRRRVPRRTAR